MAIRQARIDDAAAVIELFTNVVAERRWLGTEPGFDRERYRAAYADRIASDEALTLVAEIDGDIVGELTLWPQDNGLHELGMLIAPEYRGQSLGTQLLATAQSWVRDRRNDGIALSVFPHNDAALRLYEKLGFQIVGRREDAFIRQTGEVYGLIEMEWHPARTQRSREDATG